MKVRIAIKAAAIGFGGVAAVHGTLWATAWSVAALGGSKNHYFMAVSAILLSAALTGLSYNQMVSKAKREP